MMPFSRMEEEGLVWPLEPALVSEVVSGSPSCSSALGSALDFLRPPLGFLWWSSFPWSWSALVSCSSLE